jgi:hypothetical protein
MSCINCACRSKPNPDRDPDEFPYNDWFPPKKDNKERYISIEFVDDDSGDSCHAILYLGKKPHIHGLYTDYLDLSGNEVYSFDATIINEYPGDDRICPYKPRKVTTGSTIEKDGDNIDANRIVIQQHVIAFNQKQHRAADAVRNGIPDIIISDLKQIIVEFAVLIPVGPRLEHQIIPTFHLDAKYDERPSEDEATPIKRKLFEDLKLLRDLFHVFDWHAANPRISRRERPRASVEVLD